MVAKYHPRPIYINSIGFLNAQFIKGESDMIKLTRLDGSEILINEDFVEVIEETPDTVISLQNGHRFYVKENIDMIIEKARDFQRIKFQDL